MSIINDIRTELSEVKKTGSDLRNFGLIVGGITVLLSLFSLWFFGTWSLIIGTALVVLALALQRTLLYPYLAWMLVAVVMGYVVSRLLLVVLYLSAILPIGLLMRLLRKDPLHRRFEAGSYWHKRTL